MNNLMTGQRLITGLLESLAPDKHREPPQQARAPQSQSRPVELSGSVGKMQIPIITIVLILQLIISNVGSLQSINHSISNETNVGAQKELEVVGVNTTPTSAPSSSTPSVNNQQYSTSHDSEIATLWKELSKFSDKASSLIGNSSSRSSSSSSSSINGSGSDTNSKRPKNSTFTLDTLASRNPSSNRQNASDYDDRPMEVIMANIVIFVIGFCGNSLVILVILKFTRIETVTDIYILNLAFADLMFLFGLVFLTITMYIGHWIFGTPMCKLFMACTSLNQFASSLLLVVMSFDRFLAVCHPIYAQRFRRLKRAKTICLCIWIACLILMIPIFSFARAEVIANEQLTCAIFWPEYNSFNCEIAFTLYSFAIGFAVPLLLIAAFYTCVIRKLRIAANGPINLGSSRRSRSRENTNKRIEHLVIGIICTYTICWLPYWITQLCVSFTTLENAPIMGFYPLVLIATCLTYTNSALNPILYAFLSDNFKRRCSDVFRSILSVKWCHQFPPTDGHSTVATTIYEASEVNNKQNQCRPESRQTVIMNEAVRLVTCPSQLALDILKRTDISPIANNNNISSNNNNNNSSSNNTNSNTNINDNSNSTSNDNNRNSNSNSNNDNVKANNISINMKSNSNSVNYMEMTRVDTIVSRCNAPGGVSVDSAPAQHCYSSDEYIEGNDTIIGCNCNELRDLDNYTDDLSNNGDSGGCGVDGEEEEEDDDDDDDEEWQGRDANDLHTFKCGCIADGCNSISYDANDSSACKQTRKKSVAFDAGQQELVQSTSVELFQDDPKATATKMQQCQGAV